MTTQTTQEASITKAVNWGDGTVPVNPALEVLELPGLDHSLQVSGDVSASFDALRTVTDRVSSFLASLAGTP